MEIRAGSKSTARVQVSLVNVKDLAGLSADSPDFSRLFKAQVQEVALA